MKLNNSCYDKIKLLHKISCIVWFIEKHVQVDAKEEGDTEFLALAKQLHTDLLPYIDKLHMQCCKKLKL